MFAIAVASLFALSTLAPSAVAVPSGGISHRNVHRAVPAQFQEKRDYAEDAPLLEPYAEYSERYQLWHCADLHNSTFWSR